MPLFIYVKKNMLNLPKKRNIHMPENCHTNLAKPVFFFNKENKETNPKLCPYIIFLKFSVNGNWSLKTSVES